MLTKLFTNFLAVALSKASSRRTQGSEAQRKEEACPAPPNFETMKYLCLDCGHVWDTSTTATHRRCPVTTCRSYDVAPISFYQMEEEARRLGINDNTPMKDVFKAFRAVFKEERILRLGFKEFWRVMKRVIRDT